MKILVTGHKGFLGSEFVRRYGKDYEIIGYDHKDKEELYLFKHLGGTLIIREGEGHMGSDSFKQPYQKFPLLENY